MHAIRNFNCTALYNLLNLSNVNENQIFSLRVAFFFYLVREEVLDKCLQSVNRESNPMEIAVVLRTEVIFKITPSARAR